MWSHDCMQSELSMEEECITKQSNAGIGWHLTELWMKGGLSPSLTVSIHLSVCLSVFSGSLLWHNYTSAPISSLDAPLHHRNGWTHTQLSSRQSNHRVKLIRWWFLCSIISVRLKLFFTQLIQEKLGYVSGLEEQKNISIWCWLTLSLWLAWIVILF